ncbi:expressed unknown protein [Seminavis robusta]|uniref:Uncharacterized protein n=1 Tax=Seminavis robusta TaxID=568900 RepID=A0A9N8DJQ8_9STRA|nr:expressed unknown protein [Seminavis robusta]|eukprot:Sro179_g078430.1 n/a (700) ;mRNA; f:26736-28923
MEDLVVELFDDVVVEDDFDLLWDEPRVPREIMDLQNLEADPSSVQSYELTVPTDANYADRLGLALQRCSTIQSIDLNFAEWTKWGALEVMNFLEQSTSLQEITFRAPYAQANMTVMRTLSSLLEAVAVNSNANIQSLSLMDVPFQGKNVSPLCQILTETKTIRRWNLSFSEPVLQLSSFDMDRMADAFANNNNTLEELNFGSFSNSAISVLFAALSKKCPSTLQRLRFRHPHGRRMDLEIKGGLEQFLMSSECHLERLELEQINLDMEHSQGLLRGLLGNKTLDMLQLVQCQFTHEPHLAQLLSDMTQPRRLQLVLLSNSNNNNNNSMNVIGALQRNTCITHCKLIGLQHSSSCCGHALEQVLTHNRSIRHLQLYWDSSTAHNNHDEEDDDDDDEDEEDAGQANAEEMRLIANGLRVNPILQSLTLHNFGVRLDEEAMGHLASALQASIGRNNQPDYSLLDLSLESSPVSDQSLAMLAKALCKPGCRLRSLFVELEEAPSAFYKKGIVKLFESLAVNQSLESLQIGHDNEQQGLDPHVLQSMARALHGATKIQKLTLNVGFDSEEVWRSSSRSVVRFIYAAWLAALAGNTSLHSVQFATVMYDHLSVDDKEFWKAVSFFGLRNRLLTRLRSDQEILSVAESKSLTASMVLEELKTHRPWTLPSWRIESDPAYHALTELSLFYLCLRLLPHLLTGQGLYG